MRFRQIGNIIQRPCIYSYWTRFNTDPHQTDESRPTILKWLGRVQVLRNAVKSGLVKIFLPVVSFLNTLRIIVENGILWPKNVIKTISYKCYLATRCRTQMRTIIALWSVLWEAGFGCAILYSIKSKNLHTSALLFL